MPLKNKEANRKYNHDYYQRNRERRIAYQHDYYQRNRESALLYGHVYQHGRGVKTKREILTHYGNGKLACVRCGFTDIRALSLDHINGQSFKDCRTHRVAAGYFLYQRLRKEGYPLGYRTLCMNCQFVVRFGG